MGLFTKKENKETLPKLPELPRLPNLPNSFKPDYGFGSESFPIKEFPSIENEQKEIHELPSFPTNSFSDKFSQNSIKSAITGNDFQEESDDFEEFSIEEKPKKIKPLPQKTNPLAKKRFEEKEFFTRETNKITQEEPVFIRIDKFEESLKIFNGIAEKMSEIELLLKETKQIKEKEDEELSQWQQEVQKLKNQIEKIDKDIFSKI